MHKHGVIAPPPHTHRPPSSVALVNSWRAVHRLALRLRLRMPPGPQRQAASCSLGRRPPPPPPPPIPLS